MSQRKSGGSGYGTFLLHSLVSSGLALAAAVSGVVLSGEAAKALTCSFGSPSSLPPTISNCVYGPGGPAITPDPVTGYYKQWLETNKDNVTVPPPVPGLEYFPTDKDIWFISGPSKGTGNIEWKWIDKDMSGTWLIPPDARYADEWHVDVDFNPDVMNPPEDQSLFSYVVIIDKGQGGAPHNPWNPWFGDVSLQSVIGPPPPGSLKGTVTKTIWEAICTSSTPGGTFDSCGKGDLLGTLTNMGSLKVYKNPSLAKAAYDKLYIEDLATANNSTIDNYQNIYRQVPGPLPVLGAGVALGYSRKLRRRVKESQTT